MPWLEMSPMEERVDLVREYASGWFTMTELAAQYGISRKTGYKWLDRHARRGTGGLGGSLATPARESAGHGCDAGGRADAAETAPSPLGAQETVGGGRASEPRGRLAVPLDRRGASQGAWTDHGASAAPAARAGGLDPSAHHGRE